MVLPSDEIIKEFILWELMTYLQPDLDTNDINNIINCVKKFIGTEIIFSQSIPDKSSVQSNV
jgi:hypothetical protein